MIRAFESKLEYLLKVNDFKSFVAANEALDDKMIEPTYIDPNYLNFDDIDLEVATVGDLYKINREVQSIEEKNRRHYEVIRRNVEMLLDSYFSTVALNIFPEYEEFEVIGLFDTLKDKVAIENLEGSMRNRLKGDIYK